MAVYRFESEGKLFKLDTDTATLLLSTRWSAGREQTRWNELYKTRNGRYVCLSRTLWQGEHDSVQEMSESAVLRELALAEDSQRTVAGEALLEAGDPSEEA